MRRFALIGAGFIGGVHANNLAAHPDVDFALVYDVDETRAKSVADRYNARVATLDEVFDPTAVDAVFIASSTDTHADHLRRAATAGLPVLCEKPIDLDLPRPSRWFSTRMTEAFPPWSISTAVSIATTLNLRRVVASGDVGSGATDSDDLARPVPAAARVHRRLRRPDARSDRPLLRPREVDRRRGPRGRVRDGLDADRTETAASTATSTSPRSLCGFPAARWSRSTVRARSATDTTNASRYSDRPAWSKRAAIGPVRYLATQSDQVVDDGLHDSWFERVAASYRAALDHFVDALEGRTTIGPTWPRR